MDARARAAPRWNCWKHRHKTGGARGMGTKWNKAQPVPLFSSAQHHRLRPVHQHCAHRQQERQGGDRRTRHALGRVLHVARVVQHAAGQPDAGHADGQAGGRLVDGPDQQGRDGQRLQEVGVRALDGVVRLGAGGVGGEVQVRVRAVVGFAGLNAPDGAVLVEDGGQGDDDGEGAARLPRESVGVGGG